MDALHFAQNQLAAQGEENVIIFYFQIFIFFRANTLQILYNSVAMESYQIRISAHSFFVHATHNKSIFAAEPQRKDRTKMHL